MKSALFVLSIVLLPFVGHSQSAYAFLHNANASVTYYGIDFSHIQFKGRISQFDDGGIKDAEQLRDVYFPGWNGVVINEPRKYDLGEAFRKNHIVNDIRMITQINAMSSTENRFPSTLVALTREDIDEIVASYPIQDGEGYGIVFIAELFDKTSAQAWIHIVVFDEESKRVLIHERTLETPGGFGLRSYWIRTIFGALENIDEVYYDQWLAHTVNLPE